MGETVEDYSVHSSSKSPGDSSHAVDTIDFFSKDGFEKAICQ